MRCNKAERLLLRSLDGRLKAEEKAVLADHLRDCGRCRRKEEEYRTILGLLRPELTPEPLPYFAKRLTAKLKEKEKAMPAYIWLKWAHRAVAFSFVALLLFGGGVLLFRPKEPREWSQAETLLLHNENPLSESANILEQRKPEDRNMMLIFAAAEEKESSRSF